MLFQVIWHSPLKLLPHSPFKLFPHSYQALIKLSPLLSSSYHTPFHTLLSSSYQTPSPLLPNSPIKLLSVSFPTLLSSSYQSPSPLSHPAPIQLLPHSPIQLLSHSPIKHLAHSFPALLSSSHQAPSPLSYPAPSQLSYLPSPAFLRCPSHDSKPAYQLIPHCLLLAIYWVPECLKNRRHYVTQRLTKYCDLSVKSHRC